MLVPKSLWTLPSPVLWNRVRLDTSRKQVQCHRCFLFARIGPKWEYEARRRRESDMFAPAVVWAKCWGHSLLEAGRKQGEEVAMQAKFVPGGFFCCFRLHLEKHRGCTRNAVCMQDDDWEILGVQEAQLSWTANDCVRLFFFSSTLSDERCSNLSFESPNQNPKNRTLNSHRDTGGTRRVLWVVTMYGHLPPTKLGFLAVQLWPIFLLKYSLRRAMLQLEFRWSKPDEKHPKQSKTETRKTAFRSSKILKSYAGNGPAAAGCPVSNPDNNCANGLLLRAVVFFSASCGWFGLVLLYWDVICLKLTTWLPKCSILSPFSNSQGLMELSEVQ